MKVGVLVLFVPMSNQMEEGKMAKINLLIPQLSEEYVMQNQRQMSYSIETLVNQLNFSYQNDLKNEQDAFNFFMNS